MKKFKMKKLIESSMEEGAKKPTITCKAFTLNHSNTIYANKIVNG